jgi:hypothetical protein
LGLLLLFDHLLPSMLPSREPLKLVPCDSGSANITDTELFVGEGGPEFCARRERAERCMLVVCCASVISFDLSAAAKGFNEAIRLVGSEGTHWRACPKEDCCCIGLAAAAAAIVGYLIRW